MKKIIIVFFVILASCSQEKEKLINVDDKFYDIDFEFSNKDFQPIDYMVMRSSINENSKLYITINKFKKFNSDFEILNEGYFDDSSPYDKYFLNIIVKNKKCFYIQWTNPKFNRNIKFRERELDIYSGTQAIWTNLPKSALNRIYPQFIGRYYYKPFSKIIFITSDNSQIKRAVLFGIFRFED